MARTKKQRKGDACEEKAITRDTIWKNYNVRRKPKNNKGYDYEREKSRLFWDVESKKEYVEIKARGSKQTKAQKNF